mmetsp:Transcript_2436/g.7307  ORF Transcript_2436/g.7307 Transcript_2436/m.7307 type:complete len:316 (+) Transcript_2436:1184-2131(+)
MRAPACCGVVGASACPRPPPRPSPEASASLAEASLAATASRGGAPRAAMAACVWGDRGRPPPTGDTGRWSATESDSCCACCLRGDPGCESRRVERRWRTPSTPPRGDGCGDCVCCSRCAGAFLGLLACCGVRRPACASRASDPCRLTIRLGEAARISPKLDPEPRRLPKGEWPPKTETGIMRPARTAAMGERPMWGDAGVSAPEMAVDLLDRLRGVTPRFDRLAGVAGVAAPLPGMLWKAAACCPARGVPLGVPLLGVPDGVLRLLALLVRCSASKAARRCASALLAARWRSCAACRAAALASSCALWRSTSCRR